MTSDLSKSCKRRLAGAQATTVVSQTSDLESTPPVGSLEQQRKKSKVDDSNREQAGVQKQHAFETNVLDHCETPRIAYEHLQTYLFTLSKALKIERATNLRIWDPFYCDGSMKEIFQELGFTKIIHDNLDFYDLVEKDAIPDHDVLVTNPPYSDDHIDRLLQFIVSRQVAKSIPCCLLLPNWVSRKPEFRDNFVRPLEAARQELFYLTPVEPYTYIMPSWVSQLDRPGHVGNSGKTTPYLSSWYLLAPTTGEDSKSTYFMDRMDSIAKRQKSPSWVVAKTVKGLKWKIQKVSKKGKKKR